MQTEPIGLAVSFYMLGSMDCQPLRHPYCAYINSSGQ